MDIEVLNRVILARHLYELGVNASKSSNDNFLFAAINLLQDSVEAFMLAVSDHVNAGIDQNVYFDKYFDLINKKITPRELPFRNKLIRVNRLRINSKHYGIQPARDEVSRLFVAVREFFDEVSNSVLGASFSTLSIIDLLKEGEVKSLLLEAKKNFEEGDFSQCAINCRKAIYLELEKDFDISAFKEGAKRRGIGGLLGLGPYSRAPFYAKDPKYIDENVKDPTDFIVCDHTVLDQDLLKYSIDSTSFWNVWRLTPEVWRDEDKNWYVKRDFDKLENEHIKDRIEYIYSTTADIIYSIAIKKANVKSQDYQKYVINLADMEIPVYEKADRTSKMIGMLPKGTAQVDCGFSVEGFNRDGTYWRISHSTKESYIGGYIHDEYLVWK